MAYKKKEARIADLDNSSGGKRRKLTDKQQLFVYHYVNSMNGAEAVRKAGYKCKSEHHESNMSNELRNHPVIAAFIEEEMEKKRRKSEVTAEYILQKLIKIVEETESSSPQSALRGLELMGKAIGLYKDRQEISGPDGKAIEMEQKVKENADDFTSKLSVLARRAGPVVVPIK